MSEQGIVYVIMILGAIIALFVIHIREPVWRKQELARNKRLPKNQLNESAE
jgi:hypothetical protein